MRIIYIGIVLVAAFLPSGCQFNSSPSVLLKNDHTKNGHTIKTTPATSNSSLSLDMKTAYLGCWSGMNGGRIRITADKISDLGSKETSGYIEKFVGQTTVDGIQTGEKYLLETERDFSKSFLSKFIQISFNNDGTVGFVSYDSYEDYLQDRLAGQGLFEKTACSDN